MKESSQNHAKELAPKEEYELLRRANDIVKTWHYVINNAKQNAKQHRHQECHNERSKLHKTKQSTMILAERIIDAADKRASGECAESKCV